MWCSSGAKLALHEVGLTSECPDVLGELGEDDQGVSKLSCGVPGLVGIHDDVEYVLEELLLLLDQVHLKLL